LLFLQTQEGYIGEIKRIQVNPYKNQANCVEYEAFFIEGIFEDVDKQKKEILTEEQNKAKDDYYQLLSANCLCLS